MNITRIKHCASRLGFIAFLLLLIIRSSLVQAALEFDPTRSLTAGYPGDRPDQPRVAYNSRHNEYLVVYQYHNDIIQGPDQIHGARLAADGSYIANYVISDLPHDCRQPDVDYDPVRDRYLVVWSYDRNGDGANWDIHGRFVPRSGPVTSLAGMKIGGFATWNETSPRLAYGAVDQDFFVVCQLKTDPAANPDVTGFRIPADGSPSWHYMYIWKSPSTGPRMHPDIAYNPSRDEYLVVYDNSLDIYGHIFPGHSTNGQFYNITDLGDRMSLMSGFNDYPAVAFSRNANYYIIAWDNDRSPHSGDIYARYYSGGNPRSSTVHIERLDNNSDLDRSSTIACTTNEPGCVMFWIALHNGSWYTFGREIILKSNASGELISHDTGFFAPLDNLGTRTDGYPMSGIAGGRKNYYLAFTGKSANAINVYGRNTVFRPFPWPMFLPAIINGRK